MGKKITEYTNTRNTFDNADEFDVSAFLNPTYESQKTTWTIIKANLATAGFASSGDNISIFTNDSGYLTTIPTHTGEVTGGTALVVDKTAITGQALATGVSGDFVLISDTSAAGALKKVDVVDFLGGGADTNFATTDLTFTVARTHNLNATTLNLDNGDVKVSTGKIGFSSGTNKTMLDFASGSLFINEMGIHSSGIGISQEGSSNDFKLFYGGIGTGTEVFSFSGLGSSINSDLIVTGDFTVDSNLLFADASSNQVAINGSVNGSNTLTVNGDEYVTGKLSFTTDINNARINLSAGFINDIGTVSTGMAFSVQGAGNDFNWYYGGIGTGTQLMKLEGTGELGIGTVTPTSKLHVNGTTLLDGNTTINGSTTLNTPTPSVIGEVWTATGVAGQGEWAAGGGADGNGIYDGSGTVPSGATGTLTDSYKLLRGPIVNFADGDRLLVLGKAQTSVAATESMNFQMYQGASTHSAVTNLVTGVVAGGDPYFAIETRDNQSPLARVEKFRIEGQGITMSNLKNTGLYLKTLTTIASTPILRVQNGLLNEVLTLKVDGKLGLGVTTPLAKLHVNGSTLLDGNTTVNGDLTVDTDALFVDASANRVGIGTNTPAPAFGDGQGLNIEHDSGFYPLEITGTSGSSWTAIRLINSDTSTVTGVNFGLEGVFYYIGATHTANFNSFYQNKVRISGTSSDLLVGSEGDVKIVADNASNLIAPSVTATFLSDGRVGIGTETPDNKMHINGTTKIDGRIEMTPITAPANPASGFSLYVDSADGDLKAKSSTGVITTLALN